MKPAPTGGSRTLCRVRRARSPRSDGMGARVVVKFIHCNGSGWAWRVAGSGFVSGWGVAGVQAADRVSPARLTRARRPEQRMRRSGCVSGIGRANLWVNPGQRMGVGWGMVGWGSGGGGGRMDGGWMVYGVSMGARRGSDGLRLGVRWDSEAPAGLGDGEMERKAWDWLVDHLCWCCNGMGFCEPCVPRWVGSDRWLVLVGLEADGGRGWGAELGLGL